MVSFDDGVMSELECDESFAPPMYDESTKPLEFCVDLREQRVKNWDESRGYIRLWAKVRDECTYTLYDTDMKPLWQIQGYVPSALVPRTIWASVIIWNSLSKPTARYLNGRKRPTSPTFS